ncbi:MAG: transposase [Chloroflexales bacterium]|nr:transposase [Chloroflexales bacterium]
MERTTASILQWSRWRRRHQAQAKFHHYRRRVREGPCPARVRQQQESSVPEPADASKPGKLAHEVWQRLAPLLPSGKRPGRPWTHDRREIVEAIVHQKQTGCAWNALPPHFPPYETVRSQLRRWQQAGLWEIAWNGLEQACSTAQLQL